MLCPDSLFGTGSLFYAQTGYLLKKDLLVEGNGTLMPFATVQSASYARLNSQMTVFDVGVNWFIKGHNSKFSLDFQNRPVYNPVATELVRSGRRSSLILQYQICSEFKYTYLKTQDPGSCVSCDLTDSDILP